jgi:ribosomal-protein-alanine N-acetyltransferase
MRRQGVARALVSSAIENGSSLSRLTLEVRQSNAAAIALYQSFGFVGEGARPRFYSHPTEDALIYSYYYPKSE